MHIHSSLSLSFLPRCIRPPVYIAFSPLILPSPSLYSTLPSRLTFSPSVSPLYSVVSTPILFSFCIPFFPPRFPFSASKFPYYLLYFPVLLFLYSPFPPLYSSLYSLYPSMYTHLSHSVYSPLLLPSRNTPIPPLLSSPVSI